jgi:alcohol dehydrogenase class IV
MKRGEIITFHGPKFVFFGRGAAERLPSGIAVASPSVYKHFQRLIQKIDGNPVLFSRSSASGEPGEDDVLKLSAVLRERIAASPGKPVVAVGGGSVIDAAKLALRMAVREGLTFEKIYAEGIPDEAPQSVRLIAAETTAGTGTAVTAVAVVTKKNNVKRGIVSPQLIPDEACYDPRFIDVLPADVFASSAMDALTHAVESYVSTIENEPAGALAMRAAELLAKNVLDGYNGRPAAREAAHCGNMMAGQAFSNARLGLCHALAHCIGGRFGVAHGRINAILLPEVIEYNYPAAAEKYDGITSSLAIPAGSLAARIRELNEAMGIENSLSFLGAEFERMIDDIAAEAGASSLMAVNPRPADNAQIAEFLRRLFEGGAT